jgi:DHA1 family bicyclomycin/chloramphenicol resistance-like MFS transporter
MLAMSARNSSILAALLLVFAVTQVGGMWVFMGILFFMVGSITPVQANTMAGGLAQDSLRAGSAAALFGAATFAGGAVASWIAGMLYDGAAPARGLSIVVACALFGVALSIWLVVLKRPHKA